MRQQSLRSYVTFNLIKVLSLKECKKNLLSAQKAKIQWELFEFSPQVRETTSTTLQRLQQNIVFSMQLHSLLAETYCRLSLLFMIIRVNVFSLEIYMYTSKTFLYPLPFNSARNHVVKYCQWQLNP